MEKKNKKLATLTIALPVELKKAIKMHAVEHDTSVSELIKDYIEREYVGKGKNS